MEKIGMADEVSLVGKRVGETEFGMETDEREKLCGY
jgi:hypothetical protein